MATWPPLPETTAGRALWKSWPPSYSGRASCSRKTIHEREPRRVQGKNRVEVEREVETKKAGRSGGGFERPVWRSPPGRRQTRYVTSRTDCFGQSSARLQADRSHPACWS